MLVWGLGVSSVDNVVKPWLISQGSDMPFLLILFGVLGGALTFGFIGVFLGPTLLAVGYRLVVEWHPALGVVGLPWASFAGSFAAQNILGTAGEDYKKYYRYFSNRRHFSLPSGEDYRQAIGFLSDQRLGEILSGRQPSKDRGDARRVLGADSAYL